LPLLCRQDTIKASAYLRAHQLQGSGVSKQVSLLARLSCVFESFLYKKLMLVTYSQETCTRYLCKFLVW